MVAAAQAAQGSRPFARGSGAISRPRGASVVLVSGICGRPGAAWDAADSDSCIQPLGFQGPR
jgi:hypothetical protein